MCAFFANLLNVPTEPKAKPFKDPIFLIGLMRSGTTLLMNTLSEHPQLLKAGFEMNKAWTEIGGAPCSVNCDERTEADFDPVYANNMTAYFTSYIQESKSIKRHLARWSAKRYYGSGAVFYDWENLYLMNKSPHLSNKIRYINKIYPNAKYIVIVRSPFGQCASLKMHFTRHHKAENYYFELPNKPNACWTNYKNPSPSEIENKRIYPQSFELIPEAWMRLNNSIYQHMLDVDNNNQLWLSYENLVGNQSKELKKVFSFLQLDKNHQQVENKILNRNRRITNTDTKGNPLEKWRKHLTEEEIKIIEEYCNKNLNLMTKLKGKIDD